MPFLKRPVRLTPRERAENIVRYDRENFDRVQHVEVVTLAIEVYEAERRLARRLRYETRA